MVNINNDLTTQIEGDFLALLDDWFSLPTGFDNALDEQIARWYSNPPNVFPKRPYFSPSSLGDCPRELYVKAKRAKRDELRDKPWRGRWRALGTISGTLIQRELLAIERSYKRLTGNEPRFRFEYNDDGTPMFEEFSKRNKLVKQDGEEFYLYGATDGIMEYITDEGEKIRVGLEVKSKQGTPARTSIYSMKQPDEAHAKQVVAYAEMFDVDYFVILYVNLAKQSWNMTDEQYAKTPDIRAFCTKVTDIDKHDVFEKAAQVTKAVRDNTPPRLDIDGWGFNNYKTATALSLTDEEVEDVRRQAEQAKQSSLPKWKVATWEQAIIDIEAIREDE